MAELFIECSFAQEKKYSQGACGDSFLSKRCDDGRLIAVLSDGLGSGVKANVLSSLTATMALHCMQQNASLNRIASTIMKTLPVCAERKISYATFSLFEIDTDYQVRVIEYDNPSFLLLRGQNLFYLDRQQREIEKPDLNSAKVSGLVASNRKSCGKKTSWADHRVKTVKLGEAAFTAEEGDRLVVFSDGVTQAGMGTRLHPLGWGSEAVSAFTETRLSRRPSLSAAQLARELVEAALEKDLGRAKDDITVAVFYFRAPRRLLLLSGPPYDEEKDSYLARLFVEFPGRKIICGGTSARIIGRELGRELKVDMKTATEGLPPLSSLPGADLVTEGILTLAALAKKLEENKPGTYRFPQRPDPADLVLKEMLESDHLVFIVGTRINEAHQDPKMPVELEIRRNVVKKIADILKDHYLKKVSLRFL